MSEHENRWPGAGPADADAAAAAGADASAGDAAAPDASEPSPAAPSRSSARGTSGRRITQNPVLLWSVVGGVVLVAVAVTAFLLLRGDDPTPGAAPAPTVTRTLPAPTATTDPIARGEGTVLFATLPDTVRQYVLTAITPGDLAAQVGALEAYDLTYAGALADVDATYTVQVVQWATPEEATAAAAALSATLGTASSTGEVLVAGTVAGAFSLFGEGDSTTEPAHAVWTNGTLVLHANGPAADIRNVYLAYSL